MVLRPCLTCGTPCQGSRCPTHTRQRQRQRRRGTTAQRGYGASHDRARAAAIATYDPACPCPRCTLPLGPDPSLLDLGHTDDRSGYEGLTHRACNRGNYRAT